MAQRKFPTPPIGVLRSALLLGGAAILAITAEAVCRPASAQPSPQMTGALQGTVRNEAGDRLQGAIVRLPALGIDTATDPDGKFTIPRVPAGQHVVIVSYPGMRPSQIDVTVAADTSEAVDVALARGATVLEEIVVTITPIRDSQAESLARQRAATNVVNIVASDAIGRFPDQNAAAALGRLPAVAVQRDQGQERFIQVRGAPQSWTTVAFDGMNVIGAEERVFRFDSVPAVVVGSLEVNKNLTPDMPAESLAGRINILTVSPFDRDGVSVQADVGHGTMELGGGTQRQGSVRLSYATDKIGGMIAASHYKRHQQTDNREFDYDRAGAPTLLDIRNYRVERENNALSGAVEFRPSEDHKLFLRALYGEFVDDEQRDQYRFRLDSRGVTGTRGPTGGTLANVPVQGYLQYGNYRNATWTNTAGGDHAVDAWDVDWRVNYTWTDASAYLPVILRNQVLPTAFYGLTYDLSDPRFPRVALRSSRGQDLSALDLRAFQLDLLLPLTYKAETDAWTYRLDVTRDVTLFDNPTKVRAGLQLDDRNAWGNTFSLPASLPTLSLLGPRVGFDWNPGQFVTADPWQTDFPLGFSINYVDNIGLRRHLDSFLGRLEAAGLYDGRPSPSSRYTVTERILAGYGMATIESGALDINAGVRVETVDIGSDGFLTTAAGVVQPVSVSRTYADVFPSLHLTYDVTDELVLRGGFTSGISRPDFGDQRVSVSINDTSRLVEGGNPYVRPETAYGVDASLEWYLSGAGLLSASGYIRRIDDVLFTDTAAVTDDRFDGQGFDRTGYAYNTMRNGSDGELMGIEFAYLQQWDFLPDPLDGFGFQGNLAFVDGEFTTPGGRTARFPGTSGTIVNASVFFEKFGLSLRLSYQWRDDWMDSVAATSRDDTFWAATEAVDFSARYALTDLLTLYFDANNLTDELGIRYRGTPDKPIEVEGFGSRYMAGLRVNY